jgi:SagB-type dehydrogenase family enzyme
MSGAGVRIRRCRTLGIELEAGLWVARNAVARTQATLDSSELEILRAVPEAVLAETLFDVLALPRESLARSLMRLMDAKLLLVEGTEAERLDARIASTWPWGSAAAAFHFGIKDAEYQQPTVVAHLLEQRLRETPQIPLTTRHELEPVTSCGEPALGEPLLRCMRARRSQRSFDPERAIPMQALGDCLFSGLGIVGWFDSGLAGEAALPLAMTPSGGARNPYEAFVRVARVSSLAPGIHHYSGTEHTLAFRSRAEPSIAELLGGQAWFESAAAVVFLVANFARTAWKYGHPGALRVVLLEAGHIAQNILLVASARNLAAAPTCALADSAIERALGLDPALQSAVYAIALGVPGAVDTEADPAHVRYEPRFL